MTTVIGIDLSLRATGFAVVTAKAKNTELIRRPQLRGTERLRSIRDAIVNRIEGLSPDLIVLEGYAHGRTNQAHQLGELGGIVRVAINEAGHTYIDLPPSSLKKYATGKGNADKQLVLVEAVKRLGFTGSDNNESDALWLAVAGHALLGAPLVDLPKTHVAALDEFLVVAK